MPLCNSQVSLLPAGIRVWVFLYTRFDSLLGGVSSWSLKKKQMGLFVCELKAKAGWLPLSLQLEERAVYLWPHINLWPYHCQLSNDHSSLLKVKQANVPVT